jgi:hypothetical protein
MLFFIRSLTPLQATGNALAVQFDFFYHAALSSAAGVVFICSTGKDNAPAQLVPGNDRGAGVKCKRLTKLFWQRLLFIGTTLRNIQSR